jgi:3-dehydroquinate synthetase
VIITDENVFAAHKKKFKGWNTIVLKPGEQYKIQPTVDVVIDQLLALGADRKTTLIGVGGGVITDITGLCGRHLYARYRILDLCQLHCWPW